MMANLTTAQWNALIDTLLCPKCGAALTVHDGSLVCAVGHCYDIAQKGYVNLAPQAKQEVGAYTRTLFAARREVLAGRFYREVMDTLADFLPASGVAADVGCGEGSYLQALAGAAKPGVQLLGFDLSRSAIIAAARLPMSAACFVADLRRLPLRNRCVQALFNILTGADYREFARVLAPDGLLVKVVPARGYLQELREIIAREAAPQALGEREQAPERVTAYFKAHATLLRQIEIRSRFDLNPAEAEAFFRMTPLTAHCQDLTARPEKITIALDILVGHLDKKTPETYDIG